jgi:hypothetical protein
VLRNLGIFGTLISVQAVVFFIIIFMAAYSDYGFRDCPNANKCEDAVFTMYAAGVLALTSTTILVASLFLVVKKKNFN